MSGSTRLGPLVLLALCTCTPEPEPDPVDVGDPVPPLEMPDLEGIDLESAMVEGMALALTIRLDQVWDGHWDAVQRIDPGCPDVFAGSPDFDEVDEDEGGLSWMDTCTTSGGELYWGFAWWTSDLDVEGQAGSVEGRTASGSRALIADSSIQDDDGVRFGFDGEASDGLYRVDAEGYTQWTYSSLIEGTVSGRDVFDPVVSSTPAGWRTDLYFRATGGDVDSLELRGNAYFFEPTLLGHFDSIAADLTWTGQNGAGPDDCVAEPRGYLSLRDTNAFWYDLVFQPSSEDDTTDEPYENDPLGACDGCGTLYIRGVEQGELCPDLSFVWSSLQPPPAEDYAQIVRDPPTPIEDEEAQR